jgi:translation initiation factor 1
MHPVVVITGVPGNNDTLVALAQQLKKLCGSGGTIKDGNIEIQGDHCDKVQAKLTELGYKVKRAGTTFRYADEVLQQQKRVPASMSFFRVGTWDHGGVLQEGEVAAVAALCDKSRTR